MEGLGASCNKGSNTAVPVAGLTMLVTNDKYADGLAHGTIDKRVREAIHGMNAQLAFGGSTEAWIADEQTGKAGKLCEEGRCQSHSRLPLVERSSGGKLGFSFRMNRVAHARLARMRASASSPGTAVTAPLSISESLR